MPKTSLDPDAQAFITAAGITDVTQKSSINTLVVSLKANSLWTKMKALYPFVGGTATTHKFNLKNPLDTDAAFRLVFNGGWTHSATGALPNGTNAWANTYFKSQANFINKDNAHYSFYSRTNLASTSVEIGADSGTSQQTLHTRHPDGKAYLLVNSVIGPPYTSAVVANSLGFYQANRNALNTSSGWKNGIKLNEIATTSSVNNLAFLSISAYNNSLNIPSLFSSKQCAFASLGDGLTDTEAANFYTAVQTFNTTLGRQVGVPIVSDADAQAFLNAAVIEDVTQADAVNQLVIDMKAANIWTKMKAIYPFVGGTATTHKFNLKNPLDTDAAFRLVFSGGWTHSANGALPNGTNAYADTFLIPSTHLITNNFNYSYYSRNTTIVLTELMGAWNNTNQQTQFVTNDPLGTLYGDSYAVFNVRVSSSVPNFTGLLSYGRLSSTSLSLFKNGNNLNTITTPVGGTVPNVKIFLSAINVNGTPVLFTPLQCAFSSIGDGLSDTEAANFYTAVQTFQTTLGRSVGPQTVSDADAQAFVTAADIQDQVQANAVNQLVIDMKAANIWTKMKAIYPFVGGTATTHKFNLKNPLDTDAAFRLLFSGGVIHDSNGITGNGTNGFANTFLNPFVSLISNSSHISLYSRNNIQNASLTFDEGLYIGSNNAYALSFVRNNTNASWSAFWGDANLTTATINDSKGLFIGTRQDSTNSKIFFNNSLKGNNTSALSTNRPNGNIHILKANGLGGYSSRNIAFYSRGDGLTDTEAANFYTAVQTFQTTLGRQI
jgi:hypothetical protein